MSGQDPNSFFNRLFGKKKVGTPIGSPRFRRHASTFTKDGVTYVRIPSIPGDAFPIMTPGHLPNDDKNKPPPVRIMVNGEVWTYDGTIGDKGMWIKRPPMPEDYSLLVRAERRFPGWNPNNHDGVSSANVTDPYIREVGKPVAMMVSLDPKDPQRTAKMYRFGYTMVPETIENGYVVHYEDRNGTRIRHLYHPKLKGWFEDNVTGTPGDPSYKPAPKPKSPRGKAGPSGPAGPSDRKGKGKVGPIPINSLDEDPVWDDPVDVEDDDDFADDEDYDPNDPLNRQTVKIEPRAKKTKPGRPAPAPPGGRNRKARPDHPPPEPPPLPGASNAIVPVAHYNIPFGSSYSHYGGGWGPNYAHERMIPWDGY